MSVNKCLELPDLTFETKAEMFRAIKDNYALIVDAKKASIKTSDRLNFAPATGNVLKGLTLDSGYIYPVINTTKYMDSHNDVHLDGIWDRSLKHVQGTIYYLANHELKVGQVVAYPKDVKVMVQLVKWKDLGFDFEGETQALMFKISKDKVRMQEARTIIEEKIDIEHSVRMQYVKFTLAIDSLEPDFKAEKENYDKIISKIVNRKRAEEAGYFFAIEEAKIIKEGSMVLNGSNDTTPLILPKSDSPEGTPPPDSPDGTRTRKRRMLF